MKNIDLFIDKLFAKAEKAGLKEYEAYYASGDSFRVMVFQGEVNDYNVNSSSGLSFRTIVDGRMGYSYSEALDDEAIDMLINNARENASIIESNDEQFIFEGSKEYSEVISYNPKLDDITAQEKINMALNLEKLALAKDEKIQSVGYCMVDTSSGSSIIRNSKGLNLSDKSNIAIAYVSPVAHEDGRMVDGSAFRISNDFGKLDIEAMIEESVEEALSMLEATSMKSGKYDIVFSHEASSDLLATFSSIFSAESAQKGLSLLKDRVGESIANDIITIVDDPLMKDGLSSGSFDSEGVATYTKNIIEDGKLMTLLHNLKTAAKDGVQTTGNASKSSYNSPVGISPSNLYIKPSNTPLSTLMQEADGGIYITELSGLHTANPVSADFSLLAKGYRIVDGKKGKAVEQITVAGNYYKLLNDVSMIADDIKFDTSSVGSPSMLLKDVSVAGE